MKNEIIIPILSSLLSVLIAISIIAPYSIKIDKDFDNTIKSSEYKNSKYLIYEYRSENGVHYLIKEKGKNGWIKNLVYNKSEVIVEFNNLINN